MHEAKTHFSRLVERAIAGERVVIARDGVPLVTLEPDWLSDSVLDMLADPEGRVVCSVGSSWEVPIHHRHTSTLADLPPLHRDPFDRLLIAQAQTESLALVTADPLIRAYPGADASHPQLPAPVARDTRQSRLLLDRAEAN